MGIPDIFCDISDVNFFDYLYRKYKSGECYFCKIDFLHYYELFDVPW